MKIAITGSAGKIGRPAIAQLISAGHRVRGFDKVPSADGPPSPPVDATDLGQLLDALSGVDAQGGYPMLSSIWPGSRLPVLHRMPPSSPPTPCRPTTS